jgi:hypothetical protein
MREENLLSTTDYRKKKEDSFFLGWGDIRIFKEDSYKADMLLIIGSYS